MGGVETNNNVNVSTVLAGNHNRYKGNRQERCGVSAARRSKQQGACCINQQAGLRNCL